MSGSAAGGGPAFYSGTWKCNAHPADMPEWCQHIEALIRNNEDADALGFGMSVIVPVFPNAAIFAEVRISDQDIGGVAAPMEMRFTPDIGRPYTVPLGYWNIGEGMYSIRGVIIDYIKSRLDVGEDLSKEGPIQTSCPSSVHSVRSARKLEVLGRSSLSQKHKALWDIVMEKACTPCIEESSAGSGNFGIDPDSVSAGTSRPWNRNSSF